MLADEGNVLKLSDHIKNNPFAKINDDDSLFGSSSKSILRQSRLQFASVLKPSSALSLAAATPALAPIQIANATTVNVNTENLFSSSLAISTFNRNAIPRKHFVIHHSLCAFSCTIFLIYLFFFYSFIYFMQNPIQCVEYVQHRPQLQNQRANIAESVRAILVVNL